MSTTQRQSHGQHDTAKHRALRRFDDLLFCDPEVCSHCFARIRDRTEHDTQTLGTGNRPDETLERAGDGTTGLSVHVHDDYGAQKSYHPQTFCGLCGSDGGRARGDHIHSLQFALANTDRIVRRLHERGYYPAIQTLYNTVEHLKTQPDYQGKDREIYAVAVHLALERGRNAPDVPSHVPLETPDEL